MAPLVESLEALWRVVAIHLWQTTIVLVVLVVLDLALRRAPARVRAALWSVGLVKVFLPLSVFAPLVRPVLALLEALGPPEASAVVASVSVRVGLIMNPGQWVAPAATEPAAAPGVLWIALTVLWLTGLLLVWVVGRGRGPRLELRECRGLDSLREDRRDRVVRAMAGLGIRRAWLLFTRRAIIPALISGGGGRIVLPEALVDRLDVQELRGVLAHEAAHRHRRDLVRLKLGWWAVLLFWFYPPLWLLRSRLGRSTEEACDDAVLEAGVAVDAFGRALARVLHSGLVSIPAPMPASLGAPGGGSLRSRLQRLRELPGRKVMMRHRFAIALAIVTVVLSVHPRFETQALQSAGPAQRATDSQNLSGLSGLDRQVTFDVAATPAGEVLDLIAAVGGFQVQSLEGAVNEPVTLSVSGATVAEALAAVAVEADLWYEVRGSTALVVSALTRLGHEGGQQPERVVAVDPKYPPEARRDRIQGAVSLRCVLLEDGSVADVRVIEGVHELLDNAAIEAVRQWKFEPVVIDAEPVKVVFESVITFRLQ